MIELTKDNVSELKTGKVVVVFSAPWCGPCKIYKPMIEEISTKISNAKFISVNVDKYREAAIEYNVASLPTTLILEDGEVIQTLVGIQGQAAIEQAIR